MSTTTRRNRVVIIVVVVIIIGVVLVIVHDHVVVIIAAIAAIRLISQLLIDVIVCVLVTAAAAFHRRLVGRQTRRRAELLANAFADLGETEERDTRGTIANCWLGRLRRLWRRESDWRHHHHLVERGRCLFAILSTTQRTRVTGARRAELATSALAAAAIAATAPLETDLERFRDEIVANRRYLEEFRRGSCCSGRRRSHGR